MFFVFFNHKHFDVLGIYFHWPFCLSKCIYCDFGSIVVDDKKFSLDFQQTYAECCKKQLLYFKKKINQDDTTEYVGSIYFGGGTPSLIHVEIIKDLISFVKQEFDVATNCEITIEANPTSCCDEKFSKLYQYGVNRISIGVQSFDDIELSFLGRKHSSQEAINTIENAKKIFPKWSFDLIYGLPRQSLEKWLKELQFSMNFKPKHISLYTLIVEKNTLLGKMVANGIVIPKSDDEMGAFYDATNNFIKQQYAVNNIRQYEVSNYATKEHESTHNLTYWKYNNYIGIGAGAHGRIKRLNSNTIFETICIKNPQKWITNIQKGGNGLHIDNELLKQEMAEEIIIMGLRTIYGINIIDIQKRFGLNIMDFIHLETLQKFINEGLMRLDNNTIYATEKGLSLLNSIICNIIK